MSQMNPFGIKTLQMPISQPVIQSDIPSLRESVSMLFEFTDKLEVLLESVNEKQQFFDHISAKAANELKLMHSSPFELVENLVVVVDRLIAGNSYKDNQLIHMAMQNQTLIQQQQGMIQTINNLNTKVELHSNMHVRLDIIEAQMQSAVLMNSASVTGNFSDLFTGYKGDSNLPAIVEDVGGVVDPITDNRGSVSEISTSPVILTSYNPPKKWAGIHSESEQDITDIDDDFFFNGESLISGPEIQSLGLNAVKLNDAFGTKMALIAACKENFVGYTDRRIL